MKTLKLMDNLYWNGVLDPELRVFDIIMNTEFGTTYNSYFLRGTEKTAVFETAKAKFWDDYKAAVQELVGPGELDYIIVDHTEPDHAGSVKNLLELYPRAVVVGTSTAIDFLKEIINCDFNSMAVGDGDTLDLGRKTLNFMVLPQLHWPDTMYTYLEEDRVLFTCDSFGSHYSHEGILRSKVTDTEGYLRATKYYFDNIIGPFAVPFMADALDRIKDLDIRMICTGHGPVLDSHLDEIFELYHQWCARPVERERKLVVMPYVSAYGYTAQLAERIAAGVADAGPIDVHTYDMVTTEAGPVVAEMAAADGLLFGSPTILGEALKPIWDLTLSLFPPVHGGKHASAFGSYGWSGEAVPHLLERLRQLHCKVEDEGFRIRLQPSDNQLLDAYEFGYRFGCSVLRKKEVQPETSNARSTLLKCLVCGAIFDSSLDCCPTCGVGKDKCVPVADKSTSFQNATFEKFLVLGGGPAAHFAAKAIRERNASASIIMITNEYEIPYNRPMLTKVTLQDLSYDRLAIESREWYSRQNIRIVFGQTVESIDVANKTVKTNRAEYVYDKLIYALGARCFVAPIPGSDQPHVVSIRSIADCLKVQDLAKDAKHAVIIGGGVMGLESGWELKKGGLDVTVLETMPALLPRQMDDAAGTVLRQECEKVGVKVMVGAKITQITDKSVLLADGTELPAELVIMSTGMRGNVAVAKDAGLEIGNIIKVDEHMATSAPDVWACGDCTEFRGQPHGFWAQAEETGRVAGANAAGEALVYKQIGSSMVINAMNTSVFALGTNGKAGPNELEKGLRTVEIRDDVRGQYQKYFFRRGQLAGVNLVGDISRMPELTQQIEEGATFEQVFGWK
ncbi:MAG: FAD-dependent oxidoreductase [Oscillospiraceae bacterium]|jgi:flavorubredoxin/NADPH-dependent 2,4-dienoyl-CoA reductase/sulfur reductase-like enzyme|nr:FAD-dependent oxidoreductase [Oscillospiraceae bacterium]MBQ2634673.1 FAD-dependent oxidoreductase [Oscillospiraceae bacterium]MBR3083915.1 FAD-dependent oxidoreductase [Oscillospiraceae bacterium]MBR6095928.1 FAD-dependent oxidoreductase [Oscillospiraceae bacterium]